MELLAFHLFWALEFVNNQYYYPNYSMEMLIKLFSCDKLATDKKHWRKDIKYVLFKIIKYMLTSSKFQVTARR